MCTRHSPFTLSAYIFFLHCILCVVPSSLKAQGLYRYQDLSEIAYTSKKDSLKKYWLCPSLYQEKETQKKYKELWASRIDFITESIASNSFIHEKEIYQYINTIIDQIIGANPGLEKPFLLLDRTSAVNAYALGGNMIAVNMGLIDFAQSREEIALVIAHEIAHNLLAHADNAMKEKAQWLTSDEYKKQLNSVLDSKYERYSRLKKVLENYSFSRSRHNRYHEADADSLAILLLKKSKIGFSANFFLRLDSVDVPYKKTLLRPLKDYFSDYGLTLEDWWMQKKSRGLSTRNYNFKDTATIEDSLKTHPDCIERYNRNQVFTDANLITTPIPSSIKDKAKKIIIWNLFDNHSLTACMYRVMMEKDRGNKDEWYDLMFYNVMAGLYLSDKQLNRFNAIGIVPKEYISKDYLALQTFFEQVPKDSLFQLYKSMHNAPFWSQQPTDAKGLKSFFAALNEAALVDTDKNEDLAAKTFTSSFSESMYCEFVNHFKKK